MEHLMKERHRHVHTLPQPVSAEIKYYACLDYDAGEITLGQDDMNEAFAKKKK
jgi:hypothetical protein